MACHSQSQKKYNKAIAQALATWERGLGITMPDPHPFRRRNQTLSWNRTARGYQRLLHRGNQGSLKLANSRIGILSLALLSLHGSSPPSSVPRPRFPCHCQRSAAISTPSTEIASSPSTQRHECSAPRNDMKGAATLAWPMLRIRRDRYSPSLTPGASPACLANSVASTLDDLFI